MERKPWNSSLLPKKRDATTSFRETKNSSRLPGTNVNCLASTSTNIVTSTPMGAPGRFFDVSKLEDMSMPNVEKVTVNEQVEETKNKILGPSSMAKRIEAETTANELAHARYVQAAYLDIMMKKFIDQHKKDETTNLANLSILNSDLSEHHAYLERMLLAAKQTKKMKEILQQQEVCLKDVKTVLERTMLPYKTLMDALESNRHSLQFTGIVSDEVEMKELAVQLERSELLLNQLMDILKTCNLLHASEGYQLVQTTLEKEIIVLKQCRSKVMSLESAVIGSGSLRIHELQTQKPSN